MLVQIKNSPVTTLNTPGIWHNSLNLKTGAFLSAVQVLVSASQPTNAVYHAQQPTTNIQLPRSADISM